MSTETPRGDTRQRILDVALELFTEHGYDATSLRQIAERLEVTKAALYYHFKSKDEILDELVGDFMGRIAALADWAEEQPRSDTTRREVLQRATGIALGPQAAVMRMLQQNQTAAASLRERKAAVLQHDGHSTPISWQQRLWNVMTDPEATYEAQLRSRIALMSVFFGAFLGSDLPAEDQQRRQAALAIATEIYDGGTTEHRA